MNSPSASSIAPAADHELRVLAGEQCGASVALQPGRVYRVGHGAGCDVRLRGGTAAGAPDADVGAELRLDEQGVEWHALGDGLAVDGKELPAGSRRHLPWLCAVTLAGTPLAVGPRGSAGWAPLFGGTGTAPAAVAPLRPGRWGRWLVTSGAAVVAASLSMWALAVVITPAPPSLEQRAQRAEALLRSAGFIAVTVGVQEGQVVVDGYLDTDAQRTRAEQMLAGQGLAPQMRVWVNQIVTRAVQDVYRVNGVQAEVQAIGPGAMRVRTALIDPAPLQQIEQKVRRDVHGLNRLEAHNAPPPQQPSPIPALDNPGKRVASIVAGALPYVVTADGTRYFVGAMLPTGHRILGIDGSRVDLEREGQTSALVF